MRPGGTWLVAGSALLIVGIAPMAASLLASTIADVHGCRLDEGSVHPCLVAGSDWGDTLNSLFVLFWLELATIWLIPPALIALAIGGWRWWRARGRPA